MIEQDKFPTDLVDHVFPRYTGTEILRPFRKKLCSPYPRDLILADFPRRIVKALYMLWVVYISGGGGDLANASSSFEFVPLQYEELDLAAIGHITTIEAPSMPKSTFNRFFPLVDLHTSINILVPYFTTDEICIHFCVLFQTETQAAGNCYRLILDTQSLNIQTINYIQKQRQFETSYLIWLFTLLTPDTYGIDLISKRDLYRHLI